MSSYAFLFPGQGTQVVGMTGKSSIRGRNVPDGRECAGLRPKAALPAGAAECPRPDRPLPTCCGSR